MPDYEMIQYDELPSLQCQLTFEGVAEASLPAIPADATVSCILRPPGATASVVSQAVVVDAVKRIVRKDFANNEVSIEGEWKVQWRVNYANGNEQTHPAGPPQTLLVHPSYGGTS